MRRLLVRKGNSIVLRSGSFRWLRLRLARLTCALGGHVWVHVYGEELVTERSGGPDVPIGTVRDDNFVCLRCSKLHSAIGYHDLDH